ncbi:hypothetical protein BUE80_DR006609 [Diplocarpon rosae]|nr:hypothetical protein BUE80_DR006609 [Diplocarpon rosae]
MVGESEPPDFPTPVVVIDKKGRAKWTVSIPPDHDFPLAPQQYAEICQQNVEVANHVEELHAHIHRQHLDYNYYHVDHNFMDVAEAEAHGLLPGVKAKMTMKEGGSVIGENTDGLIDSEFEDTRKTAVQRQQPIYALARAGYQALFILNENDETYVDARAKVLLDKTIHPDKENENGMVIGVHVRHGDRHPYEFQYKDSYVPLERYGDKAREVMLSTFNESGPHGDANMMAKSHSIFVLASDDPDVYESEEFAHAERAQELIRLASKKSVNSAGSNEGPIRKFVEENVGWEGGFFAGMFWSLGKPTSVPATAAEAPETNLPPTEEAYRLRQLVGRAYLLDLAVLGRSSDRVICTVSSLGCKVLAVMMGWERAIEQGRWVNIDGYFEWKGVDW